MNRFTRLSLGATALFLFFSITVFSQTDLYLESFEADPVEGVQGACTGMDRSTCATNVATANGQWTLTGDFSGLTSDGYLITNGAALRGQRLVNELCFLSSEFDVSNYEDINLTVDLREVGTMEPSDYIDVFYIVDGVETRVDNWMMNGDLNHTLIDDWGSQVVVQAMPEGALAQIRICMLNAAAAERFDINEVKVTGIEKQPEAVIPTMSQWTLFILGLLMMSVGIVFISKKRLVEIKA